MRDPGKAFDRLEARRRARIPPDELREMERELREKDERERKSYEDFVDNPPWEGEPPYILRNTSKMPPLPTPHRPTDDADSMMDSRDGYAQNTSDDDDADEEPQPGPFEHPSIAREYQREQRVAEMSERGRGLLNNIIVVFKNLQQLTAPPSIDFLKSMYDYLFNTMKLVDEFYREASEDFKTVEKELLNLSNQRDKLRDEIIKLHDEYSKKHEEMRQTTEIVKVLGPERKGPTFGDVHDGKAKPPENKPMPPMPEPVLPPLDLNSEEMRRKYTFRERLKIAQDRIDAQKRVAETELGKKL